MSNHQHVVLVVEDYSDGRESMEMFIESAGFHAVGAQSGAAALALLRGELACCLIVLDWWLPDMTGGEFLREVQADPQLASIPVALYTGDARVRADADTLAAKCVLVKPVDPDRLVALVEEHCSKVDSPAVA